jgi:D-glycero-alpha-D-manno-heptose-7-phosphate kinase
MIITRSPLRISIAGGGTDLPSYYRDHSGFLIAAAIDKYVYITLHRTFRESLILKYSQIERPETIHDVQHPIIREALLMTGIENVPQLEITSLADIPTGTGLGSSGSFTTALLKALYTYQRAQVQTYDLARRACEIEIDRLGKPIGKQDQFIAAYGGLTSFRFLPNEEVEVHPVAVTSETLYNLEDNLLLFYTNFTRKAETILEEQHTRSIENDQEMIHNLHFVKDLGKQTVQFLEAGKLRDFANLMNVHWEYKKKRSGAMSNSQIDEWYDLALKNGAIGGKLVGAGGGGFLLFYAENKIELRQALAKAGLAEVRFHFDFEGTRVIIQ